MIREALEKLVRILEFVTLPPFCEIAGNGDEIGLEAVPLLGSTKIGFEALVQRIEGFLGTETMNWRSDRWSTVIMNPLSKGTSGQRR